MMESIQSNDMARMGALSAINAEAVSSQESLADSLDGAESTAAPTPALAANDDTASSMRSATSEPMTWGKAGQVVSKHAAYGVTGFMPFAAAASANTLANLYQFGSEFMSNHGEEGYSALSSFLDAAGSSVKVGGAIAAVGLALAYPLGRFVIAPAAQKGYDTLVPDDMKAVVNFAADEVPVAAKKGMDALSGVAGQTLEAIKNAPETAPAALTKAGVALGGLTQRGADAVAQVTQTHMQGDARYDRAAGQ